MNARAHAHTPTRFFLLSLSYGYTVMQTIMYIYANVTCRSRPASFYRQDVNRCHCTCKITSALLCKQNVSNKIGRE